MFTLITALGVEGLKLFAAGALFLLAIFVPSLKVSTKLPVLLNSLDTMIGCSLGCSVGSSVGGSATALVMPLGSSRTGSEAFKRAFRCQGTYLSIKELVEPSSGFLTSFATKDAELEVATFPVTCFIWFLSVVLMLFTDLTYQGCPLVPFSSRLQQV